MGRKFRRNCSILNGLGDRHIYVFCYIAITQEVKAINNNTKQAIDAINFTPNFKKIIKGGTPECCRVRIITKQSHTNWLMPIGCRECSLMIQLNSIRLRLDVEDASNLGVYHSNTENCICLWLCPLLLKCLETGVICPSFCTEALCSYILFLSALHVSPTYCFWHLVQVIRYMTLVSSRDLFW